MGAALTVVPEDQQAMYKLGLVSLRCNVDGDIQILLLRYSDIAGIGSNGKYCHIITKGGVEITQCVDVWTDVVKMWAIWLNESGSRRE